MQKLGILYASLTEYLGVLQVAILYFMNKFWDNEMNLFAVCQLHVGL